MNTVRRGIPVRLLVTRPRTFSVVMAVAVAWAMSLPGLNADQPAQAQIWRLAQPDGHDTPEGYLYDPLTGTSHALPAGPEGAVDLKRPGRVALEAVSAEGGTSDGWTFEVLAQASDHELQLAPRRQAWMAGLTLDGGHQVTLGIVRSPPPHSYPWWQARWTQPEGPAIDLSRNIYRGLTHASAEPWRHAAVVFDAQAKTVELYLDYTRIDRRPLSEADVKPWTRLVELQLGEVAGGEPFRGGLLTPRLTPRPLPPHEFLRIVREPLAEVSFRSEPGPLPEDIGYVDLKLRYGAVGDGVHDDTAAFQKAFDELADRRPLEYNTLYVPPGNYLISDTIRWTRFLIVQGAGRDKTRLILKDDAPGFGDAEQLKPMLSNGWQPWGAWGRGAGNVIGNYLFDMTIDVGANNPGAVGIDFHANNHGCLENVTIRAPEGSGAIGLSLLRPWNGPALVKHVEIIGFDVGVAATHREYSMTFEFLTLRDQREVGIRNTGDILAVRKLTCSGDAPAIRNTGGTAMLTLLDSQIERSSPMPAIENTEAALFVRNVQGDPASPLLGRNGQVQSKGAIEEFVERDPLMLFPTEPKSLNLPIEDTPEVPWGDPTEWVNIHDFAHLRGPGGDWAPALQAAIDSGAETIYFPTGNYAVGSTVRLRGDVRRLFGMRSRIHPTGDLPETVPAVRFDRPLESGDTPQSVVIERMDIQRFEHASPHTLVVRHGAIDPYWNAPGCGKLFIENSVSWDYDFRHPQQVWARQWNVESHADGPCIRCNGTRLWALGFKTEYESEKLAARNGSRVEILGAFIYPVVPKIPPDRPVFTIEDSDFAVVYGTSVYTANHRVQIRERQGEVTRELLSRDVPSFGPRQRVSLYVTRGAKPE